MTSALLRRRAEAGGRYTRPPAIELLTSPIGGVGIVSLFCLMGYAAARDPALSVAATLGGLFLCFAALRPVEGFLTVLAIRPVVDVLVSARAGPVSLGQLWSASVLATAVWCLAVVHTAVDWQRVKLPFAFLGAYAGLAMLRGNSSMGMAFASRFTLWILVLITAATIATTVHGQRLLIRFGILAATVTTGAILYAIMSHHYGSAYYDYTIGYVIQRPDGFAALGVFSVVFVLIGVVNGRRTVTAALLIGALSIEVVLSYTRTEFVALVVVLLSAILVALRGRRPSVVAVSVAIVSAGAGAIYYERGRVAHRFADLLPLAHDSVQPQVGSGRFGFWTATLEGIFSTPGHLLYGGGAGSSVRFIAQRLVVNRGIWAHNDLLELFASGGVLLAFFYVGLMVWLAWPMREVLRVPGHGRAAREVAMLGVGALVAFATISLLTGAIFSLDESVLFALLIGLMHGLQKTPGSSYLDRPGPRATVGFPRERREGLGARPQL